MTSDNQRSRPMVLLLEDDHQMANMIMGSLEQGFEFEHACNVEEAQLLLASRDYEVLLCDHLMPGDQQGLDFLVFAMAQHPQARRILMTGYMNPELLSRSVMVAGLSACIMKPVKMIDLERIMRESLSRESGAGA